MEKVIFTDRIGTHTMYRLVNPDGSMIWFAEEDNEVQQWLIKKTIPEPLNEEFS